MVEHVKGGSYATPYHFVNTLDNRFDNLFKQYVKNPNLTKGNLTTFLLKMNLSLINNPVK